MMALPCPWFESAVLTFLVGAVQYDIVSSGLGAMVCTSFFVSRGQDPWTALSITVASAVVALVSSQQVVQRFYPFARLYVARQAMSPTAATCSRCTRSH